MDWLTGYSCRKELTVQADNIDANLSDFPVLVKFASDADIGAICRSDGYDIRFTASDGTTELSYDRRSFSVTGGAASGVFRVKVSTLDATTGATIYLYYGKADASDGEATGSNVYSGVVAGYALDEPSGNFADFAGSSTGTVNGTLPNQTATSKIDSAQDFNGSSDYASCGNAAALNMTTARTLSLWLRPDGVAATVAPLTKGNWSGNAYSYGVLQVSAKIQYRWISSGGTENNYATSNNVLSAATWAKLDITHTSGSTPAIYIDGVAVSGSIAGGGGTNDMGTTSNALTIGAGSAPSLYFDGILDEIMIANVARSAEWVKFAFYNESAADNEITIGSQEMAVAPTRSELSPLLFYRDEWWAEQVYMAPLVVHEETFYNDSPFTVGEVVGTCTATGGSSPYTWEIISQTLQ